MFYTRQFSNIKKYTASIRKQPNLPPIVYLGNTRGGSNREKADLLNPFYKSVYNEEKLTHLNPQHRNLITIEITDTEIEKILKNLKLNKATGPDKLGNVILKQCSKSHSKSLKLVLQTVRNKGLYWKSSQILPIFKEGKKADVKCSDPLVFFAASPKCSKDLSSITLIGIAKYGIKISLDLEKKQICHNSFFDFDFHRFYL